jgi:hypothetical protein
MNVSYFRPNSAASHAGGNAVTQAAASPSMQRNCSWKIKHFCSSDESGISMLGPLSFLQHWNFCRFAFATSDCLKLIALVIINTLIKCITYTFSLHRIQNCFYISFNSFPVDNQNASNVGCSQRRNPLCRQAAALNSASADEFKMQST